MSTDDLRNWLLDKLLSCYPVASENLDYQIYWYYDESYIRKNKLLKLNNISNDDLLNHKINGECLFIQDTSNKFIWCDHKYIWNFLESNYTENEYNINTLIEKILINKKEFNDYNYFGYYDHEMNKILLLKSFKELKIIDYSIR